MKRTLLLFVLFLGNALINSQVNTLVSENVFGPVRIIRHNHVLFFIDNDSGNYSVKKVDFTSTTPVAELVYGPLDVGNVINGIAVHDNLLYITFSNVSNKSTIGKIDLNSTPSTFIPILTNQTLILSLAIGGNQMYLYSAASFGAYFHRITLPATESSESTYLFPLTGTGVRDIAIDGNTMYFCNSTGIRSVDISSSPYNLTTVAAINTADGLHVDNGYLVFAQNGQLKRLKISNPSEIVVLDVTNTNTRDAVNFENTLFLADDQVLSPRIATLEDAVYLNNETQSFSENILKIFPNPVISSIHFNGELSNIFIFDSSGKIRLSSVEKRQSINVTNLEKGVYFLNALNKNGAKVASKFIKK